jgi:hypothetical protein
MKTAKNILLFGATLILTGCMTLYKPNAIHSPLLKEKGEGNTSISLGISDCGLFNAQSSYAVSNHAGILADVMYHYRSYDYSDSLVEKLNIVFGETGAGYFNTLGNKKNLLFQCYAGGGYGSTADKIHGSNSSNPEVSAKYCNFFIQPGLSYFIKHIKIAFDLRTNYIHLFQIHAFLYEKFEWWNTEYEFHTDAVLDFLNVEPAVTVKIGGSKLEGVVQFGITIPTIKTESYHEVSSSSLLAGPLMKFSVGINYTFRQSK